MACLVLLVGVIAFMYMSPRPRQQPQIIYNGPIADKVLVEKAAHRLTLLRNGQAFATYQIALGRGGVGPKQREGDGLTPEGLYIIDGRNDRSAFHLSLHISYPNEADKLRATLGGYSPGGDIMIHALSNGMGWIGKQHLRIDWTLGCIAVTNEEMDELWGAIPNGTVIEIRL